LKLGNRTIVLWLVLTLLASYLSLMSADGVVAQQQPLWSYPAGGLSVSVSSGGDYIAVGGTGPNIYSFARAQSTPIWSYQTGADRVWSVCVNNNYIAAGGDDQKIYLFSRSSSIPLWSYNTGGWISSVSASSDFSYIAVGCYPKVYLFSNSSSTPLWSYNTGSGGTSVSVSSSGSDIAAGSGNRVYLFSRTSSTPLWSYPADVTVNSVAITSDGNYIVAASGENTGNPGNRVYLFSRTSSTPIWSYQTYQPVRSVTISQDGNYIVAAGDGVYLFYRTSSTPVWTSATGPFPEISISSNGNYIAVGDYNGKVYFFSSTDNNPIWSYDTGETIYSVSISSDGSYIAAGGNSNTYLFSKEPPNYAPTLILGSVSPPSGTVGTTFTYEVTYTDVNGDSPYYVRVYIDGSSHTMNYVSGTYTGGATYHYTTTLSAGSHYYYFEASDGKATARLPTSGTYSGPTVVERFSTTLTIDPSSFTLALNGSKTLTVTLEYVPRYVFSFAGEGVASDPEYPVPNRTITWSATAGSFSSSSTITNSSGQASVTYYAPNYATTATITASFAGDSQFESSSSEASVTIQFEVTLWLYKPSGSALAYTEIYYGTSEGQETSYLGTTDFQGKITTTNSALSGRTIYFKSSDGRYAGSTYVSSSGGDVSTSLTEAAGFPWLAILALVVVCGAVGGVVLAWKRGPKRSGIVASAGALGFIVPFLLTLSWSAIGAFLIGGSVSAWCAVVAYWGVKAKAHMEVRAKARPKPPKRAPPEQAKPAGRFCTHCKLKLPADAEFCPECGRRVK